VALTRAKKHLNVSYALNDNAGKSLEASVFVDEISEPGERQRESVAAGQMEDLLRWAMQPVDDVTIKMANAVWIERTLQQFTMSATSLSRFLYCPLAFYYEQVLRVPFQKNDALAFGSAIHFALERLFIEMKNKGGVFPEKEYMIDVFMKALYAESACFTEVQLDRRKEQGTALLSEYYDHYLPTLHKETEIEYKVPRYNLEGVPVTAKIDKIEMYGDTVRVVDYKTGDPDKAGTANLAPPNEKNPDGGDYWRQMVLYKLFLERFPDRYWKVTEGKFDYIQKNKYGAYKQFVIPIFQQDEEFVLKQLKESYSKIMNHEFDKGCGREECHWCNFARKFALVRPVGEAVEMDEG